MRRTLLGIVMLLSAVAVLGQNASDLYQQGLARETAGDLNGAIQIFERIVRDYSGNRMLTAKVLLQLGEWTDVLGQSRARTFYERVARDYSDQGVLAAEARKWLVAKGPAKIEIVTPYTRDLLSFALSPSGRALVFVATVNGATSLWIREIDSGKQAPIPGTTSNRYQLAPNGANPFWSPDGRSIGYFEDLKLKSIPVTGGPARTLADAPRNLGGAWGSDGTILFTPENTGPLFRVSAAGGSAVPATRVNNPTDIHHSPRFLPDGRRFVFEVVPNSPALGTLDSLQTRILPIPSQRATFVGPHHMVLAQRSLMIQEIDLQRVALIGTPTEVSAESFAPFPFRAVLVSRFHRLSTSDSGDVAYRANWDTPRRLSVRDRTGREIGQLTAASLESPEVPRISPDGKTLGVRQRDFESLLVNLANGETRSQPLRTNSTISSIIWSPAGSIVFGASGRLADPAGSNLNLYQVSLGTGGIERFTEASENQIPMDWRGDSILIERNTNDGDGDMYLLSLSDRANPKPVAVTPGLERNARFAPGGKWVVYESDDVAGRSEVFLQPLSGPLSARQQVSINGGSQPEWSASGRELYYLAPDNRLMLSEVTVSADSDQLQAGKPRVLFTTSLPDGSTYAPAPDGQRFFVNEPIGSNPIKIVRGVTQSQK
ncbi:MAG TPA: hypothetical protein VMB70_00820 [Terriglobia bacterium]|nr:hypothetical protein [Terriglobia bacterium]